MPNAIITGATQGIGKAIAEKLLSDGFSVAICSRTKVDIEKIEKEWSTRFPDTTIIAKVTDLSVKEQVQSFAETVLSVFDSIDIVVNNAGLFFPGSLAEEPDEQMEQLMDINFFSAYHLTRAVLPKMKQQHNGHIFNICSVASLKAYPNGGAYGVTKYAMLGFNDNLREELKEEGIKVTAVCPGATNSRSWQGAGIDPGRIMNPEDIADMVWAAYSLSVKACVEMIVMRPQLGDL